MIMTSQNCQETPLRNLNTIQTRRQIAGTKYDYETPGSNPESPKQLQLLSLLIPPELFVTVKDVNAKQGVVQDVPKQMTNRIFICYSAPVSSPLALLEQTKKVKVMGLLLCSMSAIGEVIGHSK